MLQFFIICGLFLINDALTQDCEADDQYPWSYHGPKNGPDHWAKDYPGCGRKYQSPIEIKKKFVLNAGLPKLNYSRFNTPITQAMVQNIGWTVMVTPEDGVKRTITLKNYTFILDEIHFHFGSVRNPGAENVLDGTRYEMEVHYVTHLKEDPNDIVVVASLMQAMENSNSGFDPIIEVLSKVKYANDSTELESDLDLAGLLPQDSGSYYSYKGSNAIPPCEPGLTWCVLKEIGKVGSGQLDKFMALYSVGEKDASDLCLMGPNYRPEQDLNHRVILGSK